MSKGGGGQMGLLRLTLTLTLNLTLILNLTLLLRLMVSPSLWVVLHTPDHIVRALPHAALLCGAVVAAWSSGESGDIYP